MGAFTRGDFNTSDDGHSGLRGVWLVKESIYEGRLQRTDYHRGAFTRGDFNARADNLSGLGKVLPVGEHLQSKTSTSGEYLPPSFNACTLCSFKGDRY